MKPTDPKIKQILKKSFKESVRLGGNDITPDHILLAIFFYGYLYLINKFKLNINV